MNDSYVILGLIQKHAPNGSAQQKAADEYNKLPLDEKERLKWAACVLVDGILYGNWPWTVI